MSTILRSTAKVVLFVSFFFISTVSLLAQPDIEYQPFIPVGQVTAPMQVESAPGDVSGRLFIVEKAGRIRIWNGTQILPTSFLNITGLVEDLDEQGLLGMAFHPQYQTNGYYFVYYNNNDGDITVARYQVSANPNVTDPNANPPSELISIPKTYDNHNGGHLEFRVEGGVNYLYFATGDGGSANDPDRNAQDPGSFLGKMIRINVDVTPFQAQIWGWGLRNPFRWSFDRATGDLWIGDVGQSSREEINFTAAGVEGVNYGWPCVEGTTNNANAPAGSRCDTVSALDDLPIEDYDNPTLGASVIGGYVYRGSEYPTLQGYYLATDFYSGNLWVISPQTPGPGWDIDIRPGYETGISSISEIEDGTLFAVSLGTGAIYKIGVPAVTPVDLVSFSGKPMQGYNELSWITVTEENIDKYQIEYSTDGRNFSSAGEVRSLNSANRSNYSFRHNIVASGILYYRLRINELNGSFKYSAVIQVSTNDKKGIRVYPTVIVNNTVNVVTAEEIKEITVVNSNGTTVWSRQMNGAQGFFTITLPTLAKGTYLIRLSGKESIKTEKIIIQ